MTSAKRPPAWRRYLRFWGTDIRDDVDDELRFHIEMRIKEYLSRGMAPDDARRLAEDRFGNVDRARTACVEIQTAHVHRSSWLNAAAAVDRDVRFASRVLRRQWLPSVVAAACVALGIGATTAMFSVANTLLLRPLPYPNGDRLVSIGSARRGVRTPGLTPSSYADFGDWRALQHSFSEVAASTQGAITVASGEPTRASSAAVTVNLFPALGVSAEIGRLFQEGDDRPGAPATAIVSHSFAERQLGGTTTLIGRRIRMGGARWTIIGVLPDRFAYPAGVDVWFPLNPNPLRESRGSRHLDVIAALRPRVTLETADRDVHTIGARLARDFPDDAEVMPFVQPLREVYVGPARSSLTALGLATILILIVACANVAALQLARASARAREIAVRAAIGAGRQRIVAQLLTESVILGLAGGAGGVGLAFAARRLCARAVAATAPPWMTFDIDGRAVAFATAASVLTAIAFGLAPAFRLARSDTGMMLRAGTSTPDRASTRLQRAFLVVQLAVSIVLVVGATLSVESVLRLRNVPLGFDPAGVQTFRLSMQGQRYDFDRERTRVITALVDSIRAIPGVEMAAAMTNAPVQSCCSQFAVHIEGRPTAPNEQFMVTGNIVTPGLFKTLRIPLVAGRDFGSQDDPQAPEVVVINETFAKRFWPAGDAIGHRIETGGNGFGTIVGVVGDIKQGRLIDPPEPQFYRAYAQSPWTSMSFVVRMRNRDSTHLAADVRRAARGLDPIALPIARVVTMQRVLDDATASNRVLGQLLALFAGVALVLAAIGIYAIMSFFVSRRTRELGLRIALGAAPVEIMASVLRESGVLVVIGGVIGLAGAGVAASALAHTLYGVSGSEPMLYVIAAGTLVTTAFAASVGPARRASVVDPLVALRTE